MAIHYPMLVTFSILRASMSSEIAMRNGLPYATRKLNLVLLADNETMIQLAGGKALSATEVHFSISSEWRKPAELDLSENEVGFLCHTREASGSSYVHGAAIWPNEFLPEHLLADNVNRSGHFTIASLSTIPEYASQYLWEVNSEYALRLSSVSFSVSQQKDSHVS